MSKLAKVITDIAIGAGLIALAFFLPGLSVAIFISLIASGASFVLSGIATELTPSPLTGIASATRNSVKPYDVVFGQTKIGGTIVYMGSFGDDSKYLDLVIMLAAHPCQSVDALLLDNQRVLIEPTTGCSFTPDNVSFPLTSVVRVNDIVTCTTASPHGIESADTMLMHDISVPDLNGRFIVENIDDVRFRYLQGGADVSLTDSGFAQQQFPDYRSKIYFEALTGTHTSTFNGMLYGTPYDGDLGNLVQNDNNPWNADCLNLGKTSVMLRFHYNDEVFTGGLPSISFIVSGKNTIFDPRTNTFGHTYNAALCVADFLSNTIWGFKAKYGTDIPLPELIAAANVCDESVPTAAGTNEPRYEVNGTFDLSLTRGTILSNLLSACGGRITYTGGRWVIHPAKFVDPGTNRLSLQQAAGPYEVKGPSVTTLFNAVRGRYVSPANGWVESDIPPYMQDSTHGYSGPVEFEGDANLAADAGDRRYLTILLPFTSSTSCAQRLAKIALLRSRFGWTGTFSFNLAMYKLSALDALKFSLPLFGWTDKLFEITSHRFAVTTSDTEVPILGTEIELRETDPSIYEWSVSEEQTNQSFRIGNALPLPTDLTSILGAIKPAGAAQVFLDASIFNHGTMSAAGAGGMLVDPSFDGGMSGFGSTTVGFAGTIAASGTTAGAGTATFGSPIVSTLSSAGVGSGSMAGMILASVNGNCSATVALTGTRL